MFQLALANDGTKCYIDDTASVFYVAPHYVKDNLTPKACQSGCANAGGGITLAGITAGNICLCGSDTTGKYRLRDLK